MRFILSVITIREVAKYAGVSVSTVSRVINDLPDVSQQTRQKVHQVIEEYGYFPNVTAKTLKQAKTNIICIVVKGTSNPFFVPIVEKIQQEIGKAKYIPLVHYIDESADEVRTAISLVMEKKALGIVFLGGNPAARPKAFAKIKVPCVLVTLSAQGLAHRDVSSVSVNDFEAARQAIDYVIANGHKEIAILGGRRLARDLVWERFTGAKQSIADHGLTFNEDLYIESMFTLKDAHAAMSRVLSAGRPAFTALFAMSDIMAIGAVRAIFDRGFRVPEDISVIGFDGIEMARYYNPTLTTVRQPAEEIAQYSADLIIQNIRGVNPEQVIVLDTKIIAGSSVSKRF